MLRHTTASFSVTNFVASRYYPLLLSAIRGGYLNYRFQIRPLPSALRSLSPSLQQPKLGGVCIKNGAGTALAPQE